MIGEPRRSGVISMADQETKTAVATAKPKPTSKKKPRKLPPWNVVLLNDDDHSYEYVIEMLRVLFGYPDEKGFQLAKEVDTAGRVIVLTTHKEKAELKRDQIHAYGTDHRVATCKGSMSSIIEPAEEA
jgi:ATP-dependent Clp protease adaptor protein ClpS